jgi:non-ribosomal peptide synthetase component E (peptide arylation enzyme)
MPVFSYSYDPTSPDPTTRAISAVRLLAGDIDLSQTATSPKSAAFADQEYQNFLALSPGGDTLLAAVWALLALASDKARLASLVQLQNGGSVDLRALANELRQQATTLREMYNSIPAEGFAETNYGQFSLGPIILNVIQRRSGS